MPTVTGPVTKHIIDDDWHKFTINGIELKTKQESAFEGLEKGMHVQADYTEKVNGRFTNRFLGKWQLTDSPTAPAAPAAPQDKDGHVAAPDWDGRDRRIAAESAYSTAARMMTALAATRPEAVSTDNLHRLAHAIYKRVQLAGQDKPWGTEE